MEIAQPDVTLSIPRAAEMTAEQRKEVAAWLRWHADYMEREDSERFTVAGLRWRSSAVPV